MDATSMALCHTKVEEIRRRISEGELTAQQIHDILISEIENELNRPTKEVNMAYVKICEELLSSLGADDEPLVDQYYISNRRSIQKVLEKSHFPRRRLPESYNSMTKVAEQQNLEYRDKNVESAYNESLRLLKEYSQKTSTDEFLPKFRGEISKLYDTPCFEIEPSNNWTIIMSEAEALASLEKIISKMSRALGEWNDIVNNERNDIMQNALLETCKIVGATCIGINSNKDFANVKFDVAIIDEAGQIQIHNALIPMSRARKNLLLGDYKQIPPCANDDVVAACEADEIDTKLLNMSFFEYIFEAMRKKTIDRLESQGLDRSLILKPVLEDYEAEP